MPPVRKSVLQADTAAAATDSSAGDGGAQLGRGVNFGKLATYEPQLVLGAYAGPAAVSRWNDVRYATCAA